MPGPIKTFTQNLPKDIGESVVTPVVNEFQKDVEQGILTVFGVDPNQVQKNQNPQDAQRLQQEEQNRKADEQRRRQNVMAFFQSYQNDRARVTQQQKYIEGDQKQEEVEEGQKVKKFEKVKEEKKNMALFRSQRKAEFKPKGG